MTDYNTPFIVHAEALARAESGVKRLVQTRNDRWYPAHHIAGEAGWINDPNGLCFFQGRYHVFYQHCPHSVEWGPMHWGHVSSEDLVTWRREPIALAPSIEADRDGCWSGSCVVGDDGRLYAYYTGHRWATKKPERGNHDEVQCLAVSDDGIHFQKHGVVVPNPEHLSNFRDPKVWRQADTWCMVCGRQTREGRGQVVLFTSTDMFAWEFAGVLYECPDPNVRMLECPDLFALGDSWMLVFSAMGMKPKGFAARNYNNAGYVVGNWELGSAFVPRTEFRLCDWGHNFYAPQSFESPDGRRIQLGWMFAFGFEAPEQADGWCGQLTQPRELTLGADDVVRALPTAEVLQNLGPLVTYGPLTLRPNTEVRLADDATCGAFELTIDLAASTAERIGLKVHETADGSYLYVAYDAQIGCVVADRRATRCGNRGYRAVPVACDTLKLLVCADRGSVEVYVNDGEAVLSEMSFPGEGPRALTLVAESGTAVLV